MQDDIRWVKTHCGRMDHGGCALQVAVKDNRIVKIKGDPEGFLNRGYVCPKGLASPDRLTHPDRLTRPLRRKGERGGGEWETISWQTALDEIARNLNRIKKDHGSRAVAFGVGMPKGLDHFVLIRLANLFGSPNVVASQDVCHAPREISGLHTCGFYPVTDFHHKSKLVVLWGSNITATNEEGEICSLLLEQVKAGTELVVVDPRRIDMVGKSSKWLRLRPGTDHALAMGFLNVIIAEELYDQDFVAKWTYGFDDLAEQAKKYPPREVSKITWVPAEQIRETARLYAQSSPAAIQWGNPIEHNMYTFDTTRALICLMAICGNLETSGGNIQAHDPQIMRLGEFVRTDRLPNKRKDILSAHYGVIPRFMTVPPAFFRNAVLEGTPYPVKGFYAMCSNPLLSYADSRRTYEALNKLDFMAVADLFMTPTASLADIVLPVASHFEIDDIGHYGLGHGYILARPKVVDPPAECWPDMQIMNELGKLISPAEQWHADYRQFLEDVLKPSGLSYRQLMEKGYLKGPDKFRLYEERGFRTATGKVELRLSKAEKYKIPALPAFNGPPAEEESNFPLILTSSKNRYFLHSSYRWVERLRDKSPHPRVEIHPATASEYGIREGDTVIISTRYGSISHIARITEKVDPRVVNADHGWWFPEAGVDSQYGWRRSNFNMLTSTERLGKEFGTPNLKGLACRIERKADKPAS